MILNKFLSLFIRQNFDKFIWNIHYLIIQQNFLLPAYDDVTRAARSSVFSQEQMNITIGGKSASITYEQASRYLQLLAGKTGGHAYSAGTTRRLVEVFTRIVQELRQQYYLGYYPQNQEQSGRRRIKVKASLPNSVVKTRRNYVYGQVEDFKKQ